MCCFELRGWFGCGYLYMFTTPSSTINVIFCFSWSLGLIHQAGNEPEWIHSLTALQNITCLERLDLEDTKVSDAALLPLTGLQQLTYLSLKSVFLTDMSLYVLQSLPKLTNLSLRDAVLTNAGIDSFNPPETLRTLDLWGCWLLTEDVLLQFCKRHPQIEVRHELVRNVQSDQDSSTSSTLSQSTLKMLQVKQKLGKMHVSQSNKNTFLGKPFACFYRIMYLPKVAVFADLCRNFHL